MTGFNSKRQMAADKFIAAEERKVGERYGYVPKLHPNEWMDEPTQEPVACIVKKHLYMAHEFMSEIPEGATLLYTAPPKRPWVGLTDKEVLETMAESMNSKVLNQKVYEAIEAKLKEKNV